MSVAADLATYLKVARDIEAEFPDFEVEYKDQNTLMKVADVCLKIITFGRMKTFMTSFVTTMGNKIYVPRSWDDKEPISRAVTLRHERVHLRQRAKMGTLLFVLRYFCWPLPAVLALGRLRIEQEAYEESLRAWVEYRGTSVLEDAQYREHIIGHFTSPNYFWTYPFKKKLNAWYDSISEMIRLEAAS